MGTHIWTILDYLLREGLVAPEAIAAGDLEITELRSRNTAFRVVCLEGPSYFIKHGLSGTRSCQVPTEAAAYAWLWQATAASPFRRYLPAFYRYDAETDLLVLQLYPEAETPLEYHGSTGRFPVALAQQMGTALSALHRLRYSPPGEGRVPNAPNTPDALSIPSPAGATRMPVLPCKVPWVLSIHLPGAGTLADMSAANIEYVAMIQRYSPFESLLDTLRKDWRTECLVHGDLKWANCLLHSRRASSSHAPSKQARRSPNPRLKIIDWEFAAWGDPCWDVGSVLADYLHFWLLSIPISGHANPDELCGLASYPIESMQPAMQAFWQTYCDRSRIDPEARLALLLRSVRYAAARLIQYGFEQNQYTPQLSSNVMLLLQLSLNMLERPFQAIMQLLGVGWSGLPMPVLHRSGAA